MKITIETIVNAPIEDVWRAWTTPDDIKQWNTASEDWHTTRASVDLRVGGSFSSRMEAKDGSMGFDFAGTYTKVGGKGWIDVSFVEGRWGVGFFGGAAGVTVGEPLNAESRNPFGQRLRGCRAVLNNSL